MLWTEITAPKYRREQLRYASDTTDKEWAVIAPYMPPPRPVGHPRTTDLRSVVDAMFSISATGCQWRMSYVRQVQQFDLGCGCG